MAPADSIQPKRRYSYWKEGAVVGGVLGGGLWGYTLELYVRSAPRIRSREPLSETVPTGTIMIAMLCLGASGSVTASPSSA
jgi:hypothetical protein